MGSGVNAAGETPISVEREQRSPLCFGVSRSGIRSHAALPVPFRQPTGMPVLPALEVAAAAITVGSIPFTAQLKVLLLVLLAPWSEVGVGPFPVPIPSATICRAGALAVFRLPFSFAGCGFAAFLALAIQLVVAGRMTVVVGGGFRQPAIGSDLCDDGLDHSQWLRRWETQSVRRSRYKASFKRLGFSTQRAGVSCAVKASRMRVTSLCRSPAGTSRVRRSTAGSAKWK